MTDYPDYTSLMQIVGSDIDVPISIDAATVTLDVDVVAQTVGDIAINVADSDIMIPIDVQGAYIMLPVDIQAQYVTLDVDIVAQTVGNISIDIAAQTIGNIDVNLAASAVTLNIDITAQTIGNLTIDLEAQSVGLYSYPEWAAKEGTDVDPHDSATAADRTLTNIVDYTVPTGKTLYVTHWGFSLEFAEGVFGRLSDYSDTTHDYKAVTGGYNGASMVLSKPVKIVAGHHCIIRCAHNHGSDAICTACFGGYLL